MVKHFEALVALAKARSPKKVAVAGAGDIDVLLSIKMALDEKIIDPILVGDQELIKNIAKEIDLDLENVEIIDQKDKILATRYATKLVSTGKANILMKGLINTSIIMKQVLDKEIGLRTEKLISHIAIFEIASYHKMFFLTDAAMNIAPNLEQKKQIIENAVDFLKYLNIKNPKVAILAAKEKISNKMEATVHAGKLAQMNKNGEIKDCIVDGPFALDNAVSKKSAKIKGIESEVAGDADILLAPDIEAGNILYKSLTFLGGAQSAGIIIGTKAPIILTSRADSELAKLNSIVLATLMVN
ncbi:phosphate butyryltransferase [Tissierella creatinophila]|uniref:Phosphate acetyltransferase n=1 Tax=Tissierella creatinophila DSM 6911 TaxID=1123403 RepID=A0A1U7M4A4_TISCR|nr:phosphate butyryltransferase [Tissierella creatinophila]OLS02080.1 phosphate acetyltransferase [Tissierella creatinophila DSM 6911]